MAMSKKSLGGIIIRRDENVSNMDVDSVDGRRPMSTRRALWSTSTSRKPQSGRCRPVENVSDRRRPVEKRQDGRRRSVVKRQDGDGRLRPVEKLSLVDVDRENVRMVSGQRRPVE